MEISLLLLIHCLIPYTSTTNEERNGTAVLEFSADININENITGTSFHGDQLLLHSPNMLTILKLSNQPVEISYINIPGFNSRRVVSGYTDMQLLYLAYDQHCVKELSLHNHKIAVLSGKCEEPGYVDGNKHDARFENPVDLSRVKEFYYIADYSNDCIRKVREDGHAIAVLPIHSKPVAIAGDLYVAALKSLFTVIETYSTYTTLLPNIKVRSLRSCMPSSLVLQTADGFITVLTLDEGVIEHQYSLDTPYEHMDCQGNFTYAIQTYTNSTLAAQSMKNIKLFKVESKKFPISNSLYSNEEVYNKNLTVDSRPIPARYNVTNILETSTRKVAVNTEEKMYQSTHEWHPDATPIALDNHAHDQFPHLMMTRGDSTRSWEVIFAVIPAGLTSIGIILGIICIIKKRKRAARSRSESYHVINLAYKYSQVEKEMVIDNNQSLEHKQLDEI